MAQFNCGICILHSHISIIYLFITNIFVSVFLCEESSYPVKTKWIVADFSGGKEIYDEIEKQLNGIPVGILGKILAFFSSLVQINVIDCKEMFSPVGIQQASLA